jgi:hypothetical protein
MPETPQVEAKHVAAAAIGEVAASIQDIPKEIEELHALRKQQGGEAVFRAIEEGPQEENIKTKLADISKAAASRRKEIVPLQQKKDELNKTGVQQNNSRIASIDTQIGSLEDQAQQLENTQKILEEINNPSQGLSAETVKAVGRILAQIPGFYTTIAPTLNTTPDALKTALESGDFFTNNQYTKIREIVEQYIRDERMRKRLATALRGVTYDLRIDSLDEQIAELTRQIEIESQDIAVRRIRYETAQNWYNGLNDSDKSKILDIADQYLSLIDSLNDPNLPPNLQLKRVTPQTLNFLIVQLDQAIKTLRQTPGGRQVRKSGLDATALSLLKQRAEDLQHLISTHSDIFISNPNDPFKRSQIEEFLDARSATQQLDQVAEEEKKLTTKRNQLTNLQQERERALRSYEAQVFGSLDRTVKGYWNEAILQDSAEIAQAEAQKKSKEGEAAKTKEEKVKELLDRFFQLSLYRYKNGEIVGWDDAFIKDMVKNNLLRNHPAEMMKLFIKRVVEHRADLPPNYRTEIENLLNELGATYKNALGLRIFSVDLLTKSLDRKFLSDMASTWVPKLLGYAWARGYWTDRIRFRKVQIEFLRAAYSPEFFVKALESKAEYQQLADQVMGKGVLNLQGELANNIKKNLAGADWAEFLKKMFTLLAILGLLGVVGSGLVIGAKSAGLIPH